MKHSGDGGRFRHQRVLASNCEKEPWWKSVSSWFSCPPFPTPFVPVGVGYAVLERSSMRQKILIGNLLAIRYCA